MGRILDEVTIEVIQKCSSNCIFCSSFSGSHQKAEIPLAKICEIIDFCKNNGAQTISISGGEPLLHDDLPEILRYLSLNGLSASIYSSGNVSSKFFNRLLGSEIDTGRIKFIFNYPAFKNEIYQSLISSGQFHIDSLNAMIKELIKRDIEVEAHIVPNKINFDYLYDTVSFLKSINLKRVSFLRLVLQGRAEENKDRLAVNPARVLSEIDRIKKDFGDSKFIVRGGVPFSRIREEGCHCLAGINKLIFRYDGLVFPCEAFKEAPFNHTYKLGSIYENSLEEIWQNKIVLGELYNLKKAAQASSEPCPAQMLY